ncbi:hypothetical protein MPLB_1270138 [Mesorhizobium sp. ORS 3324]|nr:hypothetical protein MPLB_1270138 [Mesorhizobium sp. ORS 3324]
MLGLFALTHFRTENRYALFVVEFPPGYFSISRSKRLSGANQMVATST